MAVVPIQVVIVMVISTKAEESASKSLPSVATKPGAMWRDQTHARTQDVVKLGLNITGHARLVKMVSREETGRKRESARKIQTICLFIAKKSCNQCL